MNEESGGLGEVGFGMPLARLVTVALDTVALEHTITAMATTDVVGCIVMMNDGLSACGDVLWFHRADNQQPRRTSTFSDSTPQRVACDTELLAVRTWLAHQISPSLANARSCLD